MVGRSQRYLASGSFELSPYLLLRFDEGSRDAYHTHAFNSISWVLKGELEEVTRTCVQYGGCYHTNYKPSLKPIYTPREKLHKMYGCAKHTWVLTFRGPWVDHWYEIVEGGLKSPLSKLVKLTHNREIIND